MIIKIFIKKKYTVITDNKFDCDYASQNENQNRSFSSQLSSAAA